MSRWVAGLEEQALALLPEPVHTYFRQGSGAGVSTAEAERAWGEHRFLPRILRDVSTLDTSTTVAGTRLSVPIGVAPSTLQRQAHPAGEVEMARGAVAAGTLLCVSSNAGSTFAAIAETGAEWWVQAYVSQDRAVTAAMLGRAVAAGAQAVVLTADTPVVGHKREGATSVWDLVPDDQLHTNEDVAPASGASHLSLEKAMDLTPDVIGWLAEASGLPVVVKGVLRADDAKAVVAAGASGVWVSNHGGRQLDRSLASARALPAVVAAVGPAVDVVVDGGIRDGLDVLAALALGARAVFVGRPALWALTIGGSAAVARLVGTLGEELREAMRIAGVTNLAETRSVGLLA